LSFLSGIDLAVSRVIHLFADVKGVKLSWICGERKKEILNRIKLF